MDTVLRALLAGALPGLKKKALSEAVQFIALNKRPIGVYRIPFSGGVYNIFLYPGFEAITCTYNPTPGFRGMLRGYEHIHKFIKEHPELSHESEFQRMAQESGFRIEPQFIPFEKKKPAIH